MCKAGAHKIVTHKLSTLTENDLQYWYNQWKKRWNYCEISEGLYSASSDPLVFVIVKSYLLSLNYPHLQVPQRLWKVFGVIPSFTNYFPDRK